MKQEQITAGVAGVLRHLRPALILQVMPAENLPLQRWKWVIIQQIMELLPRLLLFLAQFPSLTYQRIVFQMWRAIRKPFQ